MNRRGALTRWLLPYGTICYHGAPAQLRDIPIGAVTLFGGMDVTPVSVLPS